MPTKGKNGPPRHGEKAKTVKSGLESPGAPKSPTGVPDQPPSKDPTGVPDSATAESPTGVSDKKDR